MSQWKAMDVLHGAHVEGKKKLDQMERAVEDLRKGRRAEGLATLEGLLDFFHGELKTHFAHEEEALFPPLSRAIGPMGPVEVMLEEHRLLWQTIDTVEEELEKATKDASYPTQTLEQAAAHVVWTLRSHIEKEDGMLFPTAERYLSDGEKAEVTRRVAPALV